MAAVEAFLPRPPDPEFGPLLHDYPLCSYLPLESCESFEDFEDFERAMTQLHQPDNEALPWPVSDAQPQPQPHPHPHSHSHPHPHPPSQLASSQSDVANSPGHTHRSTSHHAAEGSCSLSPSGTSLILTPSSGNPDYQDGSHLDYPESDNVSSTSPESAVVHSPDGDFVYVERTDGEPGGGYTQGRMNLRPPIIPSGVSQPPPEQPSFPSRESSVSHPSIHSNPVAKHWQQAYSVASSSGTGMDDHFVQYSTSENLAFTSAFDDEVLSTVGPHDMSYGNQTLENMPYRFNGGSAPQFTSYENPATPFQAVNFRPQHNPDLPFMSGTLHQQYGIPSAFTSTPQFTHGSGGFPSPQADHRIQPPPHQLRVVPSNTWQLTPQPQAVMNTANRRTATNAIGGRRHPYPQQSSGSPPTQSSARLSAANNSSSSYGTQQSRPLVKADPSQTPGGPQRTRTSHADRVRKGGREKHSHLNEISRQKSHTMRKVGACWRCALQRDPCDEGTPCSRCSMRSQRGQTYYFDCDRSKLPDFVHDFLPPSMTLMHQKQSIEDTVSEQVLSWDHDNGIDVYLSSGYGPPLRWKLFEFKPKTSELLSQLQFYQDTQTNQSMSKYKWSPPFGLLKIDTSDDAHFDTYLDQLLEPEHLPEFGWSCYEEESLVDERMFQAQLLDLMCKLYMNTGDQALKSLLKDILRMMIITFIMGHTLTIVEQTLPTVLSSVRHSSRPPNVSQQKHTSPRLANRQLKFFFAVLRNNIYEKILKWQQSTLHTAAKKDSTWLPAFCVMLGFAMVLEEVQRTILIQADAAAQKKEMTPENATTQAGNACERIDARFKLLVGLFQCKYRDKKWGANGSFGPGTPEVREPVQREFLRKLRNLLEERCDHLQGRENVPFGREYQCLYTTRLTARFLLPFLNLPPS